MRVEESGQEIDEGQTRAGFGIGQGGSVPFVNGLIDLG